MKQYDRLINFIIFIIIFLALFGPKVAGIADLSLLAGVLGLVFFIFLKDILVSREYILVVIFTAVVVAYSILMVLINGMGDTQPVLRHFRALISTSLLGLVFYNLSINNILSSMRLVNILIAVLLINAIVIIMSMPFPDIKVYLAELYGFNKKFVDLRSFGLTAGYDTAGYLCIIGAILSAFKVYYKGEFWYSLIIMVFIVATFFTSRSSMILAVFLTTGLCVFFILKGRWILKVVSVGYIIGGIYISIYYVLPLVLSTFSWGTLQVSSSDYTSNFAATNLSLWYETMWILPEHSISVWFGAGEVVKTSDLGYVSLIFMIGVMGLAWVSLIYMYIFFIAKAQHSSMKHEGSGVDAGEKILLWSLMSIILLMYIINFKNLYFLTRGYHELIIILFFFVLGLSRKVVLGKGRWVSPQPAMKKAEVARVWRPV